MKSTRTLSLLPNAAGASMNSAETRSADSLTPVKRFSRPGGPKGHLRSLLKTLLFVVVFGAAASLSQAQPLPTYQVIFDDFSYADVAELFGNNTWEARPGVNDYQGRGWYDYNWNPNCGRSTLTSLDIGDTGDPNNGTLIFTTNIDFTLEYDCGENGIPVKIASGFTHRTGVWASRITFEDLPDNANIGEDFTQTFWITSSYWAEVGTGNNNKRWSEFNHEWQNWFNYNSDADSYIANGVRLGSYGSPGLGATEGGFPMRNARDSSADDWTCLKYTNDDGYEDVDDVAQCMEWFVEDFDGNDDHAVDLMIKFDNEEVVFAAVSRNFGEGWVWYEHRASLNRRASPMEFLVHQTSREGEEHTATREMTLDWTFYSPNTDLEIWDVISVVGNLQSQNMRLVNLDGEDLAAPTVGSWQATLETPVAGLSNKEWMVLPTEGIQGVLLVDWKYRTKRYPWSSWSSWSGWDRDALRFEVEDHHAGALHAAEVTVRVNAKYDSPDQGWTSEVCRGYNYYTSSDALCGGISKNSGDSASPALNQAVPEAYALGQNYPNPFNPSTEIIFQLPEAGSVSLVVYDVMGREVERLVDRPMEAGSHSVSWDASTLASGVYLYTITAGAFTQTRRMTLLK